MPERQRESDRVWQRLRTALGNPHRVSRDGERRAAAAENTSVPFTPGRDPSLLGHVMEQATRQFGWQRPLARADVGEAWAEIVGERAAPHSRVVVMEQDELVVQCSSTAWAQQLRLLHTPLLTEVQERFPEARIRRIKFIGPVQRSFRRGYRTVPGRGPRDTYG